MTPAIILTPALNLICERRPNAHRPHTSHMTNEARQIYKNFRDATAALIDWPGTPRAVHQVVAKMVEEFGNELDGAPDFDGDHARKVMSNVFDLRDEGAGLRPTPAEYDPEIEARRADYEKLADAIAHMAALERARCPSLLDVEGWDAEDKDHLIKAIDSHLHTLWQKLDWYDALTLRKFYAEMRLHADQTALKYRPAGEQIMAREQAQAKAS